MSMGRCPGHYPTFEPSNQGIWALELVLRGLDRVGEGGGELVRAVEVDGDQLAELGALALADDTLEVCNHEGGKRHG